jgi:hypothetical protein
MLTKIHKILKNNPGLKGRAIANRLNIDKKEINSFLSKNLDSFYKNEEHKWYNVDKDTLKINFPANTWVDQKTFENILKEYDNPFDVTYKNIVVNIPEKCSLMLISISRLLSLLNQLVRKKNSVTIDLSNCRNTNSFLNRAGFFDLLDTNIKVLPSRPRDGNSLAKKYKDGSEKLVEFGAVNPKSTNDEINDLIIQLGTRFVAHTSENYLQVIMTVFGELIGNILEHSNSSIPGFAALQQYSPSRSPKHIQTVISDSGLGIAKTLRTTLQEVHPTIYTMFPEGDPDSDVNLVKHVFSRGEISRFGEARGLGFKSSREHASKNEALLVIRQPTFSIELKYKNGNLENCYVDHDLLPIAGTHICFDFIIDSN